MFSDCQRLLYVHGSFYRQDLMLGRVDQTLCRYMSHRYIRSTFLSWYFYGVDLHMDIIRRYMFTLHCIDQTLSMTLKLIFPTHSHLWLPYIHTSARCISSLCGYDTERLLKRHKANANTSWNDLFFSKYHIIQARPIKSIRTCYRRNFSGVEPSCIYRLT